MEVSFYVDALQRGVHVFVHQHEVRINFNAAIFSERQTDLVVSLSFWVNFGHRPELYQFWLRHFRLVHHESELY